jgi:hypothetical protein
MIATADDLWILASTVYGEARGEPLVGQVAVAWTVRNRALHHSTWRGQSIQQICLAPKQYSCWNEGDPNRPKVLAVTLNDPVFLGCLHVAIDVLGELSWSPVGCATHFYAGSRVPAWAKGKTPVAVIGRHRFFEDIP